MNAGVRIEASPDLASVRRFEAAGFRAWPAKTVQYDGTWAIRMTASHPARRLNSVNPLDPDDLARLDERIARAARRFRAYGRPLIFRMSPLAGDVLQSHLDERGWSRYDESVVMRARLADMELDSAVDQIPLQDIGQFVSATLETHGYEASLRPGLTEVIESITPQTGLFVNDDQGRPLSSAICVVDGDLAGLFEVATGEQARGHGHGRSVVASALKWARMRGAKTAWLQVEARNDPAVRLYSSFGFDEVYRYIYRQPPEQVP